MKKTAPPLHHVFDLGDLSQAGANVTIRADKDELRRLAAWAGVDRVKALSAAVTLKKLSQTRFTFEADLDADIVQSCVVTLEPVETHLARRIVRKLHLAPNARPAAGELTLAAGDDDVPETISSLDYDLAAPLLEELVLAIDPYPRKEGAAFAAPAAPSEASESPFAVLKTLKKQD